LSASASFVSVIAVTPYTLILLAGTVPSAILWLHVAPCPLRRPRLPAPSDASGQSRRPVSFEDGDYALYRDLLAERCRQAPVACRDYCLMPNHVHLILVPATADGLARASGETHRQFTGFVNARACWTGHLFQGGSPRSHWTRST
jgi:hypothetical protein